jgi:hypothetical protein
MRILQSAFITALIVSCVVPSIAWAQATAQISGTVTDASGAVLPGAQVTATQSDTGFSRTAVTNETGFYALPSLLLGPYKVEASLTGFRTFVQTGVVLQVGSSPVIDVKLDVGQVAQVLEVQADAVAVETRSVGVGTVVETERVVDLPLNARQVTDLITLSGLAVRTGSAPGYTMDTGVNISVAGGTSYSVQYNLDGASHLDIYVGTNMPLPFPDALQEFNVVTSAQDASRGGHSAAAVNSVTKSGTNQLHGNLFWFLRNAAANARDAFAPKNDQLKRNQFGGTVGGPLKKDKIFFFVAYQGTTTRQTPLDTTAFVPSIAMRSGDFSAYINPVYGCPSAAAITNIVDPNGKLIFALSPAALEISKRLPQTNDPCGRVSTGNPLHENRLQVPARLDYQLSPKQTFFARYVLTGIDTKVPYELRPENVLTSTGWGADDTAQSLAFGDTYVFSPNVVNSIHVSGNRVGANKLPAEFFSPADVGVKNLYSYIPQFTAITGPGFSLGLPANFSVSTTAMTNFGVSDDVTWVRGSHQLAFGASVNRGLLFTRSNAWSPGVMIFTGAIPNFGAIPGLGTPIVGTGAAITDFLTGRITSLHQANPNPENLTQNYLAAYLQDTWKATRKLTVNFGLRWAPFMPMHFTEGDVYTFNLDNFYKGIQSKVIPSAPPGFTYPGDPGFHGKSGMESRWKNLEPRVGIAWDPAGDGKTAIRLGGGIALDFIRMDLHENTSSVAPFRLTVTPAVVSLDNPFPAGSPFPYNYDAANPSFPSEPSFQGFFPIPPDLKTTEQYSWNLGIQRQVSPSLFLSAAYVGSHLIHTWSAIDLNPGLFIPGNCVTGQYGLNTPGPCTQSNNINQRRLLLLTNPNASKVNTLGSMEQLDDGGTQRYNGLLLSGRLRLGQRVNLDGNYTWSHCTGLPITTLTNLGAANPHGPYQNNGPNDRTLDMGDCTSSAAISALDLRHIANITLVATTPKYSGGSFLNRLLSTWTFSTIFQARSGAPLTPAIGGDQAYNGVAVPGGGALPIPQRPNQVLDDVTSLTRGQGCSPSPCVSWFNPAAVALPAVGTYGNMGVGSLRGPGFWDWSQTVSRKFPLTERQHVEFRAEAFNVTNSLRLGTPNVTLSGGQFGRITSSNSGPRIMQFALKYVF